MSPRTPKKKSPRRGRASKSAEAGVAVKAAPAPAHETQSTRPRPFAFVLMPFSKRFDDAYQLAIKPACDAAGAYAERVDEQIFSGSILNRVYNQISKADLVIADLSEMNPNVFYEVGYAHALGKTTVLLTREADDIPFDLKHYSHIVYGERLVDLRDSLEAAVRWHIVHPERASETAADLRAHIDGVELGKNATVQAVIEPRHGVLRLRFALENRISRVISTLSFQVGLIFTRPFSFLDTDDNYETTVVPIDAKSRLCLTSHPFKLLPGAWGTLTISLQWVGADTSRGLEYPMTLRVFLESGTRDFPFSLRPTLGDA